MFGKSSNRKLRARAIFLALSAVFLILSFYKGHTMINDYTDPDSKGFVEMGIYIFILPPAIVVTAVSHLVALFTRNRWFIASTVSAMLMVASFWAGTAIRL